MMPDGVDVPSAAAPQGGRRNYYGRPQLKEAPFNNALVGGYVFLAGLSGAASLLSTLLDLTQGRAAQAAVRRGRYLSLLAPTLGAAFLVADLHTPQRFYNMLRVFKRTSPMSLGSWLLVGFSGASVTTAAAQFVADRAHRFGWLRSMARFTQLPAAIAGGGLATYTAALFSATSTPLWAAAPRALAVRFGAASIAGAAAAMGMGSRRTRAGRDLDSVAVAALAAELAATLAADEAYRDAGLTPALQSTTGQLDRFAGTGAGVLLPLGLHVLSLLLPRHRATALSGPARLAILGGSLAMRYAVMATGDETARRPELSLGFTRTDRGDAVRGATEPSAAAAAIRPAGGVP
jgi:formate-dependent nitrite reductase membrane component NrfD